MGEEHRDTLATMSNLANLYSEQGRNKEAEEILVEILGVARRVLGEDSRMTHDLRFNLAAVKMDEGKYAEAERVYLDEIEAARRRGGERDPFVVGGTYNLACLAMRRGQRDHALAYLRSAVDHGFNDPDSMTKDPDLEPLRADPMFESLVVAARKNGAPSSK